MCTLKNPVKNVRLLAILSLFFSYMSMQSMEQKGFIPTLENLNVLTIMPANEECTHNNTLVVQNLITKIQDNYKDISRELLYVQSPRQLTEHLVIKGMPENQDEKFITIHSRGFAQDDATCYKRSLNCFERVTVPTKGGGVLCAYTAIRDFYIHTACVTFDYPDQHEFANLAQKLDHKCLDTIIKNIPADYKKVYFGTSRGATNVLKYELFNTSNDHPCAIILESPFISIKKIISEQVADAGLSYIPTAQYLAELGSLAFIKFKFPNYKEEEDNLETYLSNIDPQVPILIAHLKHDPYVSDESMFNMVDELATQNHNIYLLVVRDTTKKLGHGRLSRAIPFQRLTNAFLKKQEIPHNKMLAQEGEALLKIARNNALAGSLDEWDVINLQEEDIIVKID